MMNIVMANSVWQKINKHDGVFQTYESSARILSRRVSATFLASTSIQKNWHYLQPFRLTLLSSPCFRHPVLVTLFSSPFFIRPFPLTPPCPPNRAHPYTLFIPPIFFVPVGNNSLVITRTEGSQRRSREEAGIHCAMFFTDKSSDQGYTACDLLPLNRTFFLYCPYS